MLLCRERDTALLERDEAIRTGEEDRRVTEEALRLVAQLRQQLAVAEGASSSRPMPPRNMGDGANWT